MSNTVAFVIFLAISYGVAASGAVFSPGPWYETLAKPDWTPPDWVFPVVWTVLFFTIALSGWLVWRRVGIAGAPLAFTFYAVQLVLNGAWSWLFFGLRRPDLALIDVGLLWLAIVATILAFWVHHRWAALLLVPYLLWVSLASVLNYTIWRMNP